MNDDPNAAPDESGLSPAGRAALTLTYLPAPPVPPAVGRQRPTVRVTPTAARHRHVATWRPGAPVDGIWRTKIAAGPDGSVYQAICGEVRRYGPDGAMMARWGREEGPGRLFSPTGISVGPDGTVYVADRGAGAVQLYGPDGRHLAAWHGGPPPEQRATRPRRDWEFPDLFDVIDVAVSGDGATVLAADLGYLELHRLGPDGRTLRLLPNNDIVALALSHDGATRYEVECKGAYLYRTSEEGGGAWMSPPDAIEQWDGGYEDVTVAPDGTIYLVSERHGKVFWLAQDGELLDAIDVGEVVLGPEPHALLEPDAWFDHRFTHRAAPSGAAATRHGNTVRLHVSLHDGSIEVFERGPA